MVSFQAWVRLRPWVRVQVWVRVQAWVRFQAWVLEIKKITRLGRLKIKKITFLIF